MKPLHGRNAGVETRGHGRQRKQFVAALALCFGWKSSLAFHSRPSFHATRQFAPRSSTKVWYVNDDEEPGDDDFFGRDWRKFRAQLISTERSETNIAGSGASTNDDLWAHPMDRIEVGSVLIASEKLGGKFRKAVILLTSHDEKSGTEGIAINLPTNDGTIDLAPEERSGLNFYPVTRKVFRDSHVSYGGRNLPDVFTVLHNYGNVEGATEIAPGVFVGGAKALARRVQVNDFHPSQAVFSMGHESWASKQLEGEIDRGVWKLASVAPEFILRYAAVEGCEDIRQIDLWSEITACLTGDYSSATREEEPSR